MAIEYKNESISIPASVIFPDATTSFPRVFWFLDETAENVYFLFDSSTTQYWRVVNITDPANPVGSDWVLTHMPDVDTGSSTSVEVQWATFDSASGYLYFMVGNPADAKVTLSRINKSNGLFEWGPVLKSTGGADIGSSYSVIGCAYSGGTFVAMDDQGDTWIWNISASTWSSTANTGNLNALAYFKPIGSYASGAKVMGIERASDGNLLVFYHTPEITEKYDWADLAAGTSTYLGVTNFSRTDRGPVQSVLGFLWMSDHLLTAGTGPFTLTKWEDKSSGVVSQQKSSLVLPNRRISIGENGSVELKLALRDEFGAPVSVTGNVRFSVVTQRGILDADDVALSLSSTGPFRDASNVPLYRELDVAINANGEATCYLQSARTITDGSTLIEDIVKVIYPIT